MRRLSSLLRRSSGSKDNPIPIAEPLLISDACAAAAGAASSSEAPDEEIVQITLTRSASGLGLIFDAYNRVSRMLPGCAAAQHGGLRLGDLLLSVDGVDVQLGDRVSALFPMHATSFDLRMKRQKNYWGAKPCTPQQQKQGTSQPNDASNGRTGPSLADDITRAFLH